jgi:hypothetical protein
MNKLAAIDIGSSFLGSSGKFSSTAGVGSLVSLFVNIAFIAAGLILLFFFIIGGIGLMGSAGESDPQKAEQAKKTLTSAVIGFVIVFASYWIVKLMGQLLGIEGLI